MYELWAVKSGTEMNTENSMVFIDSRDRSHVKDHIKKCIAEGKDLQFEFRISHPDLGERWMEAFGHTIYDDSGRAARIIGIMLDITERKKMEEEIARSNKDLEQFAYVASHDLQEPLRAVAGFVSLIQRQLQKSINEKTKEYMKFTVDAVHRMQTLIDGLLEYSRIDTRGKPPEKVDSVKSLENALLSLQASIKESGVKITSDKLPTISIDPLQFTQLFQNLIGNAIKFRSNKQPQVRISASRQGNTWTFAVKDNGIGIESQYAERIFMIFQRLHTHKQYPGTGIGLSLCKKIVERHGGKMWMESEPGKDSTFYFTIPDLDGQN